MSFQTIFMLFAFSISAAEVGAADAIRLPNGTRLDRVDFDRHVAPLFGKLGCNSGSCHGSFQGKGGFRLSLFGYSPSDDFRSVSRSAQGRRISLASPAESLLLRKPSMQTAHEGGRRFRKNSWQYAVIHRWIEQGARRRARGSAVRRLEMRLHHSSLTIGDKTSLTVTARFDDGSQQDVTPFCSLRVQDESIAQIDDAGIVQSSHHGDTAIVAEYRGTFATIPILIPLPKSQRLTWPKLSHNGPIDDEVFEKLRRLGITPSPNCSDSDFVRRVTLDVIGRVPTPREVRAFLNSSHTDKRRRLVEKLLLHPMHAALWATRLCDITGTDVDNLPGEAEMKPKRAKMWHDWFRKRIANNTPYHEIVRGVLTATSRGEQPLGQWIKKEAALVRAARVGFPSSYADQPFLDLYWRRSTQQAAEITAAAFLGVRIECAQCHKHPFDRWTQTDYQSFRNVFAHVRSGSSPELRAAVVDALDKRRELRAAGKPLPPPLPRLTDVFLAKSNDRLSPLPKALAGPVLNRRGDVRQSLYRWLIEPDNRFFARNFVNRVWAHYFGVGLVDPVDDFSAVNPPSNEKLLNRLARDFVQSGYNIRRLEQQILTSQVYQLSAEPNRTNRRDRRNYSRAYVRVLPAEVAVDSLQTAVGVRFDFGPEVPTGSRAIEIAPNQLRRSPFATVFQIFERPARKTVCDCERTQQPNIRQALYRMTNERLLRDIREGRLQKLLAKQLTDETTAEELFLATLSRFPTETERSAVREHLRKHRDRRQGFEALLWSLINTREFVTNH